MYMYTTRIVDNSKLWLFLLIYVHICIYWLVDFVKKPAIVVDVASLDEEEQSEDEHALQVSQRSIDDNAHCISNFLMACAIKH